MPSNLRFTFITNLELDIRIESLLTDAFKVKTPGSFFDDFPVWRSASGAKIVRVVALENEVLASTASLRIAKLKEPNGLSIGIIGAVATDTAFIGKGLASKCTEMLIKKADDFGLPVIVLWGSEHSMYERLGFHLYGAQVRLPLISLQNEFVKAGVARSEISLGWNHQIFEALKNRSSGLIVENEDEKWLSSHKNVKWYSVIANNKVEAYAAFGRGIDLGGLVHEWGGDRTRLLQLFARIYKEYPNSEVLGSSELFTQYQFNNSENTNEYLCMARFYKQKEMPLWFWGLDAS